MASCCGLKRQTVRHLRLNTPRWPLLIGLRLASALVASLIIAAFVVCISASSSLPKNDENAAGSNAWQWGDLWMESFTFVPPGVSLLQTLVTISYLLSTTHLIHPVIELVIELLLVLITTFPIVFCATVSGPLQRWQHPDSDIADLKTSGIMELVVFVGLCLLEIFHSGFFIWACYRAHMRRRENIMRSRAAAMKLEAGWGLNEDERTDSGATTLPNEVSQLRKWSTQRIENVLSPSNGAGLGLMGFKKSPQTETLRDSRLPSTVSALTTWDGEPTSESRRPSSLEMMPKSRRKTEASQIGVAIGKPHEIWVPITELRSESPFSAHRVVDDHEVVIVGNGEVKVVSTPREEVFMGFNLPEPSTPKLGRERKASEVDKLVGQSPDPDMPPPLQVRKSIQKKNFKLGNSWEIEEARSRPPVVDQGW